MFLLFGSRVVETVINVVSFVCGYCGVHAEQRVIKRANKLTLFFIPLFSLRSTHLNQCSNCGGITELTAEQARHSLGWARGRSGA